MNKKRDLEEALKDKVAPIIEGSMEKHWGMVIPKIEEDITDKLKQNTLELFIQWDLPFDEAKKRFKKDFFKRELLRHHGNVSQLAKFLGINRRSVHRVVKDLGITVAKTQPMEKYATIVHEDLIKKTIQGAIDQYKEVIKGEKIEKLYKDLPEISKSIASSLPHKEFTWKQAEVEFEREYFKHHLLLNNGSKTETARNTGLRIETVSRKLKKLGLR
jgi:DNA-binding NtrC family response regulator